MTKQDHIKTILLRIKTTSIYWSLFCYCSKLILLLFVKTWSCRNVQKLKLNGFANLSRSTIFPLLGGTIYERIVHQSKFQDFHQASMSLNRNHKQSLDFTALGTDLRMVVDRSRLRRPFLRKPRKRARSKKGLDTTSRASSRPLRKVYESTHAELKYSRRC